MLRDRLISTDPVLLTKCKAATNVLALSHDLQVVWIDTRTDSTQVVQGHATRDRFAMQLVDVPVCAVRPFRSVIGYGNHAVALRVHRPLPNPARRIVTPVLLNPPVAARYFLALSFPRLTHRGAPSRGLRTRFGHQSPQTHSFARPLLSIHHAARTWLRDCQIDRCPTWVVRHVEGMNWNKPDAPDGFRAYGFQPDSHLGTRRSQDACQPPIRCRRMIHSTHVRGRLLSHFLDNIRTPHS